jgi:uncharacterized protein (DUF1501 family)
MAITRRQFIKRGGLVTAGTLLGPQLFGNVLMRQAYAALEDNDRYFVIIFLDGGNDGLNTVIPAGVAAPGNLREAYNDARSNINITEAELTNSLIDVDAGSGMQLGIHPGFNVPNDFFENGAGTGGLKALYDANMVAVIQGCGYPEYSLSHEESRVIWQTGVPIGPAAGTGWVGRYLASTYGGSQIPAVNIDDSIVGELRQSATSVLAIRDLDGFAFPFDQNHPEDVGDPLADVGKKAWAFRQLNLSAITGGQPSSVYIGNTGTATLDATNAYQNLSANYDGDRPAFSTLYDNVGRSLAHDLREVARVIYGVEQGVPNVNARFFQLSNGGYDTHSDQGGAEQNGQHFSLHAELGASLKVFFDDLADMGSGLENRVTVLVWSEFSRRIPQNDNGTDHGSQGPMFVIGGAVTGGVYGKHPNIADSALDDEGNTEYTQSAGNHRSTDFRDVYGTILKHWVSLSHATVQGLLPLDSTPDAIADPDHYWRTENFDLGFV